ncbi:trypsin-like peptidase domain-containing protein [Streptomyces sp. PsTaAH-124]|uniref:trypsin-like peptidase domain-containing protein n=1 Tax=Streptomyces sp. PsTaAH-124 TaxID=1157638 RepID=UPI00037F1088|nr:trypsin-like peptidase domain-containing protein [Streptomyces sp. PsTaAH-124]
MAAAREPRPEAVSGVSGGAPGGRRGGRHALRPAPPRGPVAGAAAGVASALTAAPKPPPGPSAAAGARDRVLDASLVYVRDLAGRPRGTGFAADHHGTVITSHETVAGLSALVLHPHGADGRSRVVGADAVTELPGLDLALVRTEGLDLAPLPVAAPGRVRAGGYVRIAAGGWREARVLDTATATYPADGRSHHLDGVLELAIGTAGRDALRPGGGAAGGPVLDPETGAVAAVLGTALCSGPRASGFAVPLPPGDGPEGPDGPLADLLARNAATVPAYGPDLNLAGVLELTATSVAQEAPRGALPDHPYHPPAPATAPYGPPVERPAVARELDAFGRGPGAAPVAGPVAAPVVLGLVGPPGSGRTTELAALAGRRARGDAPAPTLWLRGADLHGADTSVADAAGRALERAARIVSAARAPLPAGLAGLTPERLAHLARAQGRPLLLLLDGPEEMPSALADRLAEWTEGTARWLRGTGARLVIACRDAYWEAAGADTAAGGPADPSAACLRLGDLRPEEARTARARYRIPDGALADADARHPLTLRLLAEVRAALPGTGGHPRLDRADVLAAHLDLMCLRVAVRLAAENDLRGTAVRRLAARVSGQVHEAARRSLGPGQGELDRAAFEEVFPWGPAPARLGGGTGWASAVLTEGLIVPAGDGYRFAHEELADWIQGGHLDLDEALRVLVHRRHIPGEPRRPLPVPHHRIGPVVQALLLLARQHGPRRLAVRLEELMCALDGDPHSWWASRLLAGVLRRVTDATPYAGVLRLLADRIGVWRQCGLPVPSGFGPGFWAALHLSATDRCDLLRRLLLGDSPAQEPGPVAVAGPAREVRADPARCPDTGGRPADATTGPARTPATGHPAQAPAAHPAAQASAPGPAPESGPGQASGSPQGTGTGAVADGPRPLRYLDAVARLLVAEPATVRPHLTRWFDDERPLPAAPHATVATAAQALLYAHRDPDPDALIETLADCPHPRAAELLTALAEEEPALLCRAVVRWAHDERPDRRATAVAQALRTVPHVRADSDRALLSGAARAVLVRPADTALHGGALTLLVADPATRARHLPQALRHFAAGDAHLPPDALTSALATHPEAVLAAFGERLRHGPGAAEALRTLADATTPGLARRVAAVVRDAVTRAPDTAAAVAAYVDRRLDQGPGARAILFPLLTALLENSGPDSPDCPDSPAGGPAALRSALGAVLATPGSPASRVPRRELLDLLLTRETDPGVLDTVLRAAAPGAEEDLRLLVHRVGLLLVRTPQGAAVFDRALAELGREVPGFAARLAGWLTGAPYDWAALVGPGARRTREKQPAGAAAPVPPPTAVPPVPV